MMNKRWFSCLLAVILSAGFAPGEKKDSAGLPPQYKKWLDEEVVYIITSKERKVFLELQSDRERDLFTQAFWKKRDPNPLTEVNEFKEEHFKRIDYANRNFGRISTLPGWKTDQGKIYIILGAPISVQHYDSLSSVYPVESWSYLGMSKYGLPDAFEVVFYKRRGVGDYRLYSPSMDGPESLVAHYSGGQTDTEAAFKQIQSESPELAQLSLSLIPGESTLGLTTLASDRLLFDINTAAQKVVQDEYAEKFLRYKDIVEVEYTANYIGNESLVVPIRDPSGIFFVDYLVELDKFSVNLFNNKYYAKIDINGNVSDKEGKTIFQYHRSLPVEMDEAQFNRAKMQKYSFHDLFPLAEGDYRFNLLIKNEASKEFTSVEKQLSLPGASALKMGDLVLSYKDEEAPLDKKKAFNVENLQLYPSPRNDFGTKDALTVFFQIFGLSQELRQNGGLRLVISQEGKELRSWVKTLQEFKSQDSFLVSLPLADIPPGYYGIRVSLLNKDKDEVLSRDNNFVVSPAAALPRPWIHSIVHTPAKDPAYLAILGEQLLKKMDFVGARDMLERAYRLNPGSPQLALSLSDALFNLKDYKSVTGTLEPYAKKNVPEVLELLGRSYQALGNFDRAILCYKDHIAHFGPNFSVLTLLGNCYYQLGDRAEALRAWERSLQMNPNQAELKKLFESLKKGSGD